MNSMRILYDQGRIVAINKSGTWEPLNGVSHQEVNEAIKIGDFEDYVYESEAYQGDVADFVVTLTICFATLIVAIYIFNIQ